MTYLTICGSGNAAHALAVVASQNLCGRIDWLTSSAEKAEQLRCSLASDGLRSTGAIVASADRVGLISADPAEVIPGADIVLIAVPAFGHAGVLHRIAPHLGAATLLGCMPARGGFEFDAWRLADHLAEPPTIFGLQTLPWSTRVSSFGKAVHIGAVKQEVYLASLPGGEAEAAAVRLSAILGLRVVPTESFLSLTLGNPGQLIHPGLMYGAFHDWDGEEYAEGEVPLLYAQASDETGALVAQLSDETLAVARAIEAGSGGALPVQAGVLPIHDWLRRVYGHVTADMSTVATCLRTGPIQARRAPMLETSSRGLVPNFDYRYLSEDVPYGLVATRALAEITEVRTPAIDEVIGWAQAALRKRYLIGGELRGPDARELPLPQNYGLSTPRELIDSYRAAHLWLGRSAGHEGLVAA